MKIVMHVIPIPAKILVDFRGLENPKRIFTDSSL